VCWPTVELVGAETAVCSAIYFRRRFLADDRNAGMREYYPLYSLMS
jgi:hypothetical protein